MILSRSTDSAFRAGMMLAATTAAASKTGALSQTVHDGQPAAGVMRPIH
jgi:hypothetical protein